MQTSISGFGNQLEFDHGLPEIPRLPLITPMAGADRAQNAIINSDYFDVSTNVGDFVAAASNEFWVPYSLHTGLDEQLHHVNHDNEIKPASTLASILGIDLSLLKILVIRSVPIERFRLYKATNAPNVMYIGAAALI